MGDEERGRGQCSVVSGRRQQLRVTVLLNHSAAIKLATGAGSSRSSQLVGGCISLAGHALGQVSLTLAIAET